MEFSEYLQWDKVAPVFCVTLYKVYDETSCVVAAGCGRNGMPPPACSNTGLYSWPLQLIAHAPTTYHCKFEIRRRNTFGFSINRSSHLWPWNWCAFIAVGTEQPPYQCWCFWDFSFSTCQTHHVTLRPWCTLSKSKMICDWKNTGTWVSNKTKKPQTTKML